MASMNEKAIEFFDLLEEMEDGPQEEGFRIENDSTAEWALGKIRDAQEDADRLKAIIAEKRAELDQKEEAIDSRLESRTSYLKGLLEGYFRSGVKTKETKTQSTYELLSGKLVMKKAAYKYDRDEKAILAALHMMGKEEYIDTVEKLKWADLKKDLVFDADTVYDPETGMIMDGITAVIEPEKFEVKI